MAGEEWFECTVDDIKAAAPNALSTGPFGSAISSRYFVDDGVPVIRGSNLSQDVGVRLSDEGLVFLSDEKAREFSRSVARRGDLVFTCWGTIDQVGLVDDRCRYSAYIVSNKQMKLTPDSGRVSSQFLYYLFSSPLMRERILNQGIGSSVPGFNLGQLRSIGLILPPLPEQRAIAHILGTLDDKIELNRRMNETLEAMARALFKSWFVDFDPVRAKAEGRDPGLPHPLANLFPASFEDSELGEIPKGWQVRKLRDLSNYLSRGVGPAYVDDGGIAVLNQKCIRDRRVNFLRARRHDEHKRSVDGRMLRLLDVVVNSTGVGTLGRIAQIWDLPERAIADSHVTVIRAANAVDPWFLGMALTGRESEVESLGEGSTGQTELSRERLGSLACLTPPCKLQVAFGHQASKLLMRISANEKMSSTLATLRDTLLPKLISGELRVTQAETALSGALL